MSDPVELRVEVRCSARHAFAVFTDKLDLWWPPGHRGRAGGSMTLEGRAGGRFYVRAPGGEEQELGTVTVWDPPSRVAYTWFPGALDQPTLVEVVFSPKGDTTLVEVRHHQGAAALGEQWPARAKGFLSAWQRVLPAFAAHLSSKEDNP